MSWWWDMADEATWQRNKAECHSLAIFHGMRHGMSNKPVSLTCCWSWDEIWLMRLPGTNIKLSHLLPVGHGMTHYEIQVPVNDLCWVPHPLIRGWEMMRWVPVAQRKSCATHFLFMSNSVTSHHHITLFFYLIKSRMDSDYVSIPRDTSWVTHGS